MYSAYQTRAALLPPPLLTSRWSPTDPTPCLICVTPNQQASSVGILHLDELEYFFQSPIVLYGNGWSILKQKFFYFFFQMLKILNKH